MVNEESEEVMNSKYFKCMSCNKATKADRFVPVGWVFEGYEDGSTVKICTRCAKQMPPR